MVKGLGISVPNDTYYIVQFVAGSLAILLNSIEVFLIRRAGTNTTDFELMLLNLATADFLSGIFFIVDAGIHYYIHVTTKFAYNLIVVSFWFYCTPIITSTNFVLLISLERLFAVKFPVKHRLWHSTRYRVLKTSFGVWAFTIIVTVVVISFDQILNKQHIQFHFVASVNVGYLFAGYLTVATLTMLTAYVIIAKSILQRNARFPRRSDTREVNRHIGTSWMKDRAALTVCLLVVAAFLVSNMPFAADLFNAKAGGAQFFLTQSNAILNPLIYFFKGYIERFYAKKAKENVVLNSPGRSVVTRKVDRLNLNNEDQRIHETTENEVSTKMNMGVQEKLDVAVVATDRFEDKEDVAGKSIANPIVNNVNNYSEETSL